MFILLPVEILSGKYCNAIDIFRVFRKQAYLRSPAHADPARSVPLHRTDIRSAFRIQFQIFAVNISHPLLPAERDFVYFFPLFLSYRRMPQSFSRTHRQNVSLRPPHELPDGYGFIACFFFCHCHTPSSGFICLFSLFYYSL